ncbi:ATP-binding protein [Streptomyces sp. RFCAC02]|uniref:ATP-binding protein n=1 Tax=Streptomyces sp. RFCAC02 TaxID=2499143 RepID=UPI0023EA7190|nr:ATP-binding protein [Streptomyces sp. RFCAC02]
MTGPIGMDRVLDGLQPGLPGRPRRPAHGELVKTHAAAQIRDLGALRWLHAGESVILFGPVGVGKTHIAQALGHLAVRQGAQVRFAKTSRILADLAGGHADRTWEKRIRELVRPDVLILDDFAMRQLNATQADD